MAHPEDDFCSPGDDSMDPALCAALAELNSAEGKLQQSGMPSVLDEYGNERSIGSTAALYSSIGVRHILPDGLDHILFVLAIFLASVHLRALIIQISAFTVAHTVTLALAASGVITPTPAVVEPLIALTIGFVAVENLFFKEMTQWRPAVEIGQLAVITAAAILGFGLRRVLHDPTGARQYRRFVVLPSSALIGFVGFWWAVVRFIP